MWKSGFSLRAATFFSPHAVCGNPKLFHSKCGRKFAAEILKSFTQIIFPHSTGLVENFYRKGVCAALPGASPIMRRNLT